MLPLTYETDELLRQAKEDRGKTKEDFLCLLEARIKEHRENKGTLPFSALQRIRPKFPEYHKDEGYNLARMLFHDIDLEEWDNRIVIPAIGEFGYHNLHRTLNYGAVNYWIYDFLVFEPGLTTDDPLISAIQKDFPAPSEGNIEYDDVNRTNNATEELLIQTPLETRWDYRTARELLWSVLFQKGYPIERISGLPAANRKAFNAFNKLYK